MLKTALKNLLSKDIATRQTDPERFYSTLQALPNPDPILRKLSGRRDIYREICMDAHVLGEIRSLRAGIVPHKWHIEAGGDRVQDQLALELCQKLFKRSPAPYTLWPDLLWNMAEAILKGFAVQEVVWQRQGDYLVPAKIINQPQRRFVFSSSDNALRLLTKDHPVNGIALGNYKWLLTRHCPDDNNPYGVALLSACFWPYTFKHSGLKFFVKFCEKYGIPWAIGKYPEGTPKPQQDALADALAQMVEDAIAAIPDTGKVELIEAKTSGDPVQERLINLCNREISKVLTSQTLATEIQGQGSRAAAETHSGREQRCHESDRKIITESINELLSWITEINFTDAKPPCFRFYAKPKARQDWVEVIDGARNFLSIPARFAHERLQIPPAKLGEDILPRSSNRANTPPPTDFALQVQQPVKHLEQWIQIFRTGEHKDSLGNVYQFGWQQLDEIVNNFDPKDPPPYVIGHPKSNDPAYGWVKGLKRQGNELWARGANIDPDFDQLIKEGRYRKRSVRIIPSEQGWTLIHVGFLGAAPPSIRGLKDNWQFNRTDSRSVYDFVF